jgi:hypothetical protein
MDSAIRDHLQRVLAWGDAHLTFEDAVKGLDPALRGRRPEGCPHSPWELVEHLRITQRDILDFCVADSYEEREWPDGYWPASPEPPDASAWNQSLESYGKDREAIRRLARDPKADLTTITPHATRPDQTYMREILVVADHTAYHLGQLVLVRRLLGAWPAA